MSQLNPEQAAAVTHPAAPLLVLAGAGSGKTRVLTQRIVHLVNQQGIPAERILAVTFTNKAAREMGERASAALGLADKRRWPLIVTFHSLGLRILRAHHRVADLPARFAIYDWGDQKALARRVLSDTKVRLPADSSPDSLLYYIGAQKTLRRSPREAGMAAESFRQRKFASLYGEYQAGLHGAGAVDFEDLLLRPLRLFAERPDVLEAVRERFQAVLVDEYQDTNENQYLLVKALADHTRHLTVVGDDDQSIYGWRGADARNISRFLSDFPEADRVALEINYRSTGIILEAANAVLATIPDRHEKTLRPAGDRGEPIRVFEAADEVAEASYIADDLLARKSQRHLPWDAFGVLYRTNKQSETLQTIFTERDIPFRVVGGQKLFERKEVKDALSFLRVMANPKDELSLRRVWNTPPRGLGAKGQQRVLQAAAQAGGGLFDQLSRPEAAGLEGRARAGAEAFTSAVNAARRKLHVDTPFPEVLREFLEGIGYDRELTRLYPDLNTLDKKRDGLDRLYKWMDAFLERHETPTLAAYLTQVALQDELDRTKEEDGTAQVTLMTIHAAKGLEFPHVYLVGLEDGLFPSARSLEDGGAAALNEERRLFYVAVTRAQRGLTLSFCRRRKVHTPSERVCSPSPFLECLPAHLIERLAPADGTEARMDRAKSKFAAIREMLAKGDSGA